MYFKEKFDRRKFFFFSKVHCYKTKALQTKMLKIKKFPQNFLIVAIMSNFSIVLLKLWF